MVFENLHGGKSERCFTCDMTDFFSFSSVHFLVLILFSAVHFSVSFASLSPSASHLVDWQKTQILVCLLFYVDMLTVVMASLETRTRLSICTCPCVCVYV